jgi:hypothetical protein
LPGVADYKIIQEPAWAGPPVILRDAVLLRVTKQGQVDFLMPDGSVRGFSGNTIRAGMTIELLDPGHDDDD